MGSVEGRGEEGPDVSTVPPGLGLPSQGKELGLGVKALARGVQAAWGATRSGCRKSLWLQCGRWNEAAAREAVR